MHERFVLKGHVCYSKSKSKNELITQENAYVVCANGTSSGHPVCGIYVRRLCILRDRQAVEAQRMRLT